MLSRNEDHLSYGPTEISHDIRETFRYMSSYRKTWLVKDMYIEKVRGLSQNHIHIYPPCVVGMGRVNPGTMTDLKFNGLMYIFEFSYWVIDVCLNTLHTSMRTVLALNATHLKGKY